ncbi:MAG TPA: hypothetical protein VNQ90_05995 [Chthoniobacteraceae bacterium]|nr:hypothetical protein [Chthoniobacteraceae bacterium]
MEESHGAHRREECVEPSLIRRKRFANAANIAYTSIMAAVTLPTSRTATPSPRDLELAKRSHHHLETAVAGDALIELSVHSRGGHQQVAATPIPMAAYRLLVQILADMAEGNAVTVIPLHREMTTQEAADFLECHVRL